MQAAVSAIEYYLPPKTVSTADLAAEFPEWAVDKIDEKMGIRERHVSAPGECASDLAVAAARRLFDSGACRPDQIDYVLLCTQSPDHFLPSTACLIQDRLGIPSGAGALDFNLGCSGYVYGLGLAQGLISSGQASTVLLITADTLTKFINPGDKSVRSVFGDAAAVTLLSADDSTAPLIGPFIYGTNGRGAPNLMVPAGGMRQPRNGETAVTVEDDGGNVRSRNDLFMDGAEIFTFSLDVVPQTVNSLLAKAGLQASDVDLFVFHQANARILSSLVERLDLPAERVVSAIAQTGNTSAASIPLALSVARDAQQLRRGARVLLAAFGAGATWAATTITWGRDE